MPDNATSVTISLSQSIETTEENITNILIVVYIV